jgi:hypothetical protein
MYHTVASTWATVLNVSHPLEAARHAGKKECATPSTRRATRRKAGADGAWITGSACYIGGRCRARRLLLPFDFGEPTGDMGMLWLDLAGLVKGGARFVKLPLYQAHIPVHKGLVCDVLIGPPLG